MNALPHWPAAMKRPTAARYCELTEASFEREIANGALPEPFMLGGKEHWRRADLDAALEKLAGGEEDWRAKVGMARRVA